MHICHDEPLLFRRKAEKRIVELSLGKVRPMRSDDLTSQAGGDRSALERMDDFLSEKVQEHGIARLEKRKEPVIGLITGSYWRIGWDSNPRAACATT